ncbi:hypothetical protein SDC9_189068 [bioreactor metagenome]|uniref:Uncharacterized protein n=1 Tax=bioreactor metagenome TaxID=1076179 RepID=A0A645HSF7_9ZZZZ
MLCTIGHYFLNFFGLAGVEHHIRQAVDPLLTQAGCVVAGFTVGHGQPWVVLSGHVFGPHNGPEGLQMGLRKLTGPVELYAVHANVSRIGFEILIGHLEFFLHHLKQGFLGIFYKLRIAPSED